MRAIDSYQKAIALKERPKIRSKLNELKKAGSK